MKCDLLLINGHVVSDLQIIKADIAIKDGKIFEVGNDLAKKYEANETHDMTGLHVLPGLIDSQVHFREPGLVHKEDLETGSLSALMGGITAYFEMPNTNPPTLDEAAIRLKIKLASEKSYTHFGFFMGGAGDNLEELKKVPNISGCIGIKIFFGSSTGNLLLNDEEKILEIFKQTKSPIAIHSEDENVLKARLPIRDAAKSAHGHPEWRNVESAISSTKKIIKLAKEAKRKVHVLHISSKDEIEFLAENKDHCTVEILPQHLILHAPDCYDKLGTYAQMNPPIREKIHQDALWKALEKGVVDVIGSDHAPHTREEKEKPYPQSPSGLPGVQTMLPLLLNFVSQGKMSLVDIVRYLAAAPARIYSLGHKGNIKAGFDADITVVDLNKKVTLKNEMIKSRVGYTPFDGMQVTGFPTSVYLLGKLAMKDGQVVGRPLGVAVN